MLTVTPTSNTKPTDSDMIAVKESAPRVSSGFKLKGGKSSEEKLNAVASEFESQFISQMLSNMFSTLDPSESLGGSDSEEVYESMLVNEYGKIIARTGGVGVADQVKRMMINQQEVE